jgi:hypothetical protein
MNNRNLISYDHYSTYLSISCTYYRAIFIFIKVKTRNAVFCTQMIFMLIYKKLFLRHKFLFWMTHIPTLYLGKQRYEDPWLFFESERFRQIKNLGP